MSIETIKLSEKKYDKYLRQFTNQNWILCVGAGICIGILPNWFDLTLNLVNSIFKKKWTYEEFKEITNKVGFSLDSWIQGCFNKMISEGKTLEEFNEILELKLYEELLNKSDEFNLKKDLIKLFENPKELKKKKVIELYDFFEKNYSKSTLIQIVTALITEKVNAKLPKAIITFNADSLLHSLIVLYSIRNNTEKTGNSVPLKEIYKKVTRKFQSFAENIPILHLHGSLSPKNIESKKNDSRDSLIFLENSYNEISNNMYSWAQTNFLYYAQSSKIVFVGLSMTDPNIRKWLSWTNLGYVNELNMVTSKKGVSLPHLWIKTEDTNDDVQDFLDVSLRHMGVKIGIIENWSKTGEILEKIM